MQGSGARAPVGTGVIGRKYGWCRFQVMVSTPEPDPLDLVATATAVVVVSSAGSLD